MTEREFQTELIRGLRSHLFHVVPIPDSGGGARFGAERVYDLGVGRDGLYYGIELKRGSTSLPFNSLQDHQLAYLAECRRSGHTPLIICLFEHTGKLLNDREKVRRSKKTLEAWAVNYEEFWCARKELSRKSAPLSWWREHGVELLPIRTPAFDKDGNPKFSKTGKREWNWGWDFRAVHEAMRLRRVA